jgi:hypothetical protein
MLIKGQDGVAPICDSLLTEARRGNACFVREWSEAMLRFPPRDWPLHFILYDPAARCHVDEGNWHVSWYDDEDCGRLRIYTHLPTGLRFAIFVLSCNGSRSLAAYCQNSNEHPHVRKRSLAQVAMRLEKLGPPANRRPDATSLDRHPGSSQHRRRIRRAARIGG